MARDSGLFQEAMKRGSAHAWEGKWANAAEEFRLAAEQFPEDMSARTQLAMALYRSEQLAEALELYLGLWKAQPSNLAVLMRVAELQETLGDKENAAVNYRILAEIHSRRRAAGDALKAWQKVVELKPDSVPFWSSLMETAAQVGAVSRVMPGYLRLSRDLALNGRFEEALQVAEKARVLDPGNPAVPSLLAALRRGLEYSWHAAARGEEVAPEELARLIPPMAVAAEPEWRSGPAAPAPVSEAESAGEKSAVDRAVPTEESASARPAWTPRWPGDRRGRITTGPLRPSPRPAATPAETAGPISSPREVLPAEPGAGTTEPTPAPTDLTPVVWPTQESVETVDPPEIPAPSWPTLEPVGEEAGPATEEADPRDIGPGPEQVESRLAQAEARLDEAEARLDETEARLDKSVTRIVESVLPRSPRPPVDVETVPSADADGSEAARRRPVAEMEPHLMEVVWPEAEAEAEPAAEDAKAEPVVEAEVELLSEQEEAEAEPVAEKAEAEPVAEAGTEVALDAEPASEADAEAEPELEEAAEAAEGEPAEAAPPEIEPQVAEEEAAPAGPDWEGLLAQAREARASGRLDEAAAGLEQMLEDGAPNLDPLVELTEIYEGLGEREKAVAACSLALEKAPDHPRALLSMARFLVADGNWAAAGENVRRAIQNSAVARETTLPAGMDLLLDILEERAARGELGGVAEALAWAMDTVDTSLLPATTAYRLTVAPVELLGQCAGEHLEEVAQLPPEARDELLQALRQAEDQVRRGYPRTAADEMYGVVAAQPDFLPAQSLLGRTLVGLGRIEEAVQRSRQLLTLYELRGAGTQSLEVLFWTVAQGVGNGEARARLVGLLRARGRADEAEMVERGWSEPRLEAVEPPLVEWVRPEREKAKPVVSRVATAEEHIVLEGRPMEPAAPPLEQEAVPSGSAPPGEPDAPELVEARDDASAGAPEEQPANAAEEAPVKEPAPTEADPLEPVASEETGAEALEPVASEDTGAEALEPVVSEEPEAAVCVLPEDAAPTVSAQHEASLLEAVSEPEQIAPEAGAEWAPTVEPSAEPETAAMEPSPLEAPVEPAGVEEEQLTAPVEEQAAREPAPWEDLLRRAEMSFESGDRRGAIGQIRSALAESEISGEAARAAFLRLLMVTGSGGDYRDELVGILRKSGLPEELAI